jgi:hypothetical protein
MSDRPSMARLVVIRLWRESSTGVRLRIIDGAELPPTQQRTIVSADVDSALIELRRILQSFAERSNGDPAARLQR